MRYPAWFYWAVLVAAVGFIVSLVLTVSAATACKAGGAELIAEIKKANGCLEFWFNRYQSLLGNALTAAVAGVTLIWISRQLKPANRQASVAAAQGLRMRADELRAERVMYEETRDTVARLMRFNTQRWSTVIGVDTWFRLAARVKHCEKELAKAQQDLIQCKIANTTTDRNDDLHASIVIVLELRNLVGSVEVDDLKIRSGIVNVAELDFEALDAQDRRFVGALLDLHAILQRLASSALREGTLTSEAIRHFEQQATS